VIVVSGLEPLVVVQRARSPTGPDRQLERNQHERARTLAGLLIVIRYMQAIERLLQLHGLPAQLPAFVSVDQVSWPQECGVYDYGRRMTVLMRTPTAAVSAQVTAIRRARVVARLQRWDDETAKLIKDLRWVHRQTTGLRRLFMRPELRRYFRLRAEMFDKSLEKGMGIGGLQPLHRMTASALAELERRVREVRDARGPSRFQTD
jgi:hypothetical protein